MATHPLRIFGRALLLRCVACGGHPVLVSWFREAPNCPRCGFRLDRAEDGYWLGSYNVNLCLTLFLLVLLMVAAIMLTWPHPPWTMITWGSVAAAIVIPFAIFPWTKTLYLAVDVIFRPPEEQDFIAPAEPGLNRRR
ncbi:MAG TPA: DUF983 domain-containing protein [Gemmatimonadales bacterium]|nr:DUF983 domain-containing protein [Gemmatimonadales bacterium]